MIVGDIGNIAILAEDGVTGVKFEYNSIETLMAALDKIEDIMGENGYRKYMKEFSPEVNYKYFMAVYKAVQ